MEKALLYKWDNIWWLHYGIHVFRFSTWSEAINFFNFFGAGRER